MGKGKLKKLFCNHDYELIEGNVPIHYPDYEPIQFGQILKCKKCNKEIRFLEKQKYDYISEINEKIKEYENAKAINTNDISDGCHTFGELYDHRAKLFSIICNQDFICENAWKSRLHDDGTMFDGYFIVGINTPKGQATYHYEMKYWDYFHIKELDKAPKWDGHTPNEAIERLLSLS